MRKKLLSGVLIAAVVALVGTSATGVAAQPAPKTWSVMVHFEYADGFSYDYPLATGVPTSEVPAILRECGKSHRTGSVVRYHCFPIPE